jgi:hypothetical protein
MLLLRDRLAYSSPFTRPPPKLPGNGREAHLLTAARSSREPPKRRSPERVSVSLTTGGGASMSAQAAAIPDTGLRG